MTHLKSIALLFLYFSIATLQIFANTTSNQKIVKYLPELQLSHGKIHDIAQDSHGYIWIATENGLTRCEGSHTTKYYAQRQNAEYGISHNLVYAVASNNNYGLWVGTAKGLDAYNPNTGEFAKYAFYNSLNQTQYRSVKQIIAFGTEESVMRTDDYYIYKATITNDTIKKISYSLFMPNSFPTAIDSIEARTIIVGNSEGVIHTLNIDNGSVYIIDSLPEAISYIKTISAESFIVGDAVGNIYVYTNKILVKKSKIPIDKVTSSEKYISTIELYKNNEVLISTHGLGLFKYNYELNSIEHIHFNNKLINLHIEKLYKDSFGNIWVGHIHGGASILLPHYSTFELTELSTLLPHIKVLETAFVGDFVFVATDGDGLYVYNKKNKKLTQYNYQTKVANSQFDNIITSLTHNNNTVWIGTYNNGLFEFNIATQRLQKIELKASKETFNISTIYIDSKQRLWIGSYNQGVLVYDIASQTLVETYTSHNRNRKTFISSNGAICFFEDSKHAMWIGSYYGMSRISDNGVKRFTERNQPQLLSNIITSLTEDANGTIWIGTKEGLNIYNPATDSIETVPDNIALHNKPIHALHYYDSKIIATTNYSLYSYNFENQQNTLYSSSNSGELIIGGLYVTDSTFYVLSESGVLKYSQQAHEEFVVLPPLKLSDVMVQGVSAFSTSKTDTHIDFYKGEYTIYAARNTKNISISFANFSFNQSASIDYIYTLDNYMHEWIQLQGGNQIQFTKLSGGSYTLRVKQASQTNEAALLTVHIIIQKNFWEHWWFYALAILAALSIFTAIYYIRIRRMRIMQKNLEQQVEDRISEVQDKIAHIHVLDLKLRKQQETIDQHSQEKIEWQHKLKTIEDKHSEAQQLQTEQAIQTSQAIEQLKKEFAVIKHNVELYENLTKRVYMRIEIPLEIISYISPRVVELTEYTDQEFYNSNATFRKLFLNEHRDMFKKIRTYLQKGKIPTKMRYEIITKNGKQKWIEQLNYIERNEEGKVVALRAIMEDATDIQKDEQEKKANSLAQQHIASFDIQTIETQELQSFLQSFFELFKDKDITFDEKHGFIETNKESSGYILHLIENLIDIAKIDAEKIHFNYSQCYVNTVLEELEVSFSHILLQLHKKKISLNLHIDSEATNFSFYTDTYRFRQVMMNLLGNAIKYTKHGSIDFGYTLIENNSHEHQQHIQFYVKDTGIGMADESKKILQSQNTHNNFYDISKGLGLSLSKQIIELMGGEMVCESSKDTGTSINFWLPLDKMKGLKKNKDHIEHADIENNKWQHKTILIVDNEESNYKTIQDTLAYTGIQTIWATNGAEAIEIYKAKQQDIDLILMDMQMPTMNGYETTQKIKALDPDIPIIAQTAYANYESKLNSIRIGCDGYIEKPYKRKELIDIINKYV